jgi:hypothetical protein
MLDPSAEIINDRPYSIYLRLTYIPKQAEECDEVSPPDGAAGPDNEVVVGEEDELFDIGTVWGGGGQEYVTSNDGHTTVRFSRLCRAGVTSSVNAGQVPFIYYI